MALASDIQSLQNFINTNVTQNSIRSIRGDQMNVILVGIMNIILGVISLANISKVPYIFSTPENISADGLRMSFQLNELIGKEIFLLFGPGGVYFPVDDLASLDPNTDPPSYSYNMVTGTISTLNYYEGKEEFYIYYNN